MKIIDLHTDTLTRKAPKEFNIFDTNFMLNYKDMKDGNYYAFALACFLNYEKHKGNMFKLASEYFDTADNLLLNHNDKFCLFNGDLKEERIQIIKTIEEGEEFEGNINNLIYFYKHGLKMTTLTWNYPNSLAFPNNVKYNKEELINGLTDTGKEFVKFMNDNNILLDVSHLGDKAFYDCLHLYHLPIIASHSNARSITSVVRNLTDDMIKIISNSGGLIGINLCERFVINDGEDYLNGLVKHLNHIKTIGGLHVLAIGSDFDGISTPPQIINCSKWDILFNKLKEEGWKEEEIEHLAYKNALRVFKSIC